ncbi:MAG: hypothetical protein GY859_32185, partial [Desulfobacterales bacterium]|nr:hypothetical protein [Desulfobacterales bacterium]
MKRKICALILVLFILAVPGAYGQTWTQVNTNGFGSGVNWQAAAMEVYNNRLYVGTRNTLDGAQVWMYNGSAWSQVNTDGFGDTNN